MVPLGRSVLPLLSLRGWQRTVALRDGPEESLYSNQVSVGKGGREGEDPSP